MIKKEHISLLEKVYKAMVEQNDFTNINDLVDVFKLNTLAKGIQYKKTYTEQDMYILGLIIKILQTIYNNSDFECPVSDEDYDILYAIHLEYTGNDIIGASPISTRPTAYHTYPELRGTLDKIHYWSKKDKPDKEDRKSLEEWISSIERKIGRKLPKDTRMIVYPKFDGVSVIFELDENGYVKKALTRGNVQTNEATDLTPLYEGIKIGGFKSCGVKTECIMFLDEFEEYKERYGDFNSPRSAASSVINNQTYDKSLLKYIRNIVLDVSSEDYYPDHYIKGVWHVYGSTIEDIIENGVPITKEKWEKKHNTVIDGWVLVFEDTKLRKEIGREGHINKYEVAYKFPPETKVSTLLDVEFFVGNLGNITPVAKIEPVKINRNTVSSISLGSMDRFLSLGLAIGDEVYVKYDIIPYLDVDDKLKKSGKEPIQAPTECPTCGTKLVRNPVLMCGNDDCPSRVIGAILNYVIKMDIENISIGTITTLFQHNLLTSIDDLYSLKKHKQEIKEIDGFGSKSVNIILDSIDEVSSVPDSKFFGALGIQNVGDKTFRKVLSIYHYNELIENIAKNSLIGALTAVDGIGEITARSIIDGINRNAKLIKKLLKHVSLIQTGGELKGKICFSQIRDKDFEKFLEDSGYEITNSVTKDLVYLIVAKGATSTKVDKALKYGVTVLDIDDAYEKFGF